MNFKYTLIAILLYACSCILYAQEIKISGVVKNALSHAPIEFANIYLANTSDFAYSKSDGSFTIEHIKPGNYELCVSCLAHCSFKEKIQLSSSDTIINIELKPTTEQISPIVVTGTGTKYKLENAPVQTEIISGKTISELSGRGIEEIISNISASLDFNSSSMGSSIKINGLGDDYVLILVDGRRLTGSVGGRFDLTRIDPENIEQIEIVKGAASTLYGSDAISGVINIITKKSTQDIKISNSTKIGAYNEWKQLNSLYINKGKISSKTSFSRSQVDGWQLSNMEYNSKYDSNHDLPYLVETYDKPVNKKHSYTITESFSYTPNKKLNLNSEFSWYEKRLFFPFKGRMYNYYYYNNSASLGGKYILSENNYINFSIEYGNFLYYNEYPYKYNEHYTTTDGIIQVTYYPGDRFKNSDQTNLTYSAKGIFKYNSHNTLSVGTEILGDYLNSKYRLIKDDVSNYTYAIYAQDELKLNKKFNIVGGFRGIYHDQFGFIFTPKLSAMYKAGHFTNRFSYANGFKSPTLKELYYYYESERMGTYTLYLGNEDLQPQKSNYFSISSEFKNKKIKTELNLYINNIKDMIDYKIIDTDYDAARRGVEETKMRYNINNACLIGFDWSTNIKLSSALNLNGSYSYVDAKNKTLNIRLDGTSEHSATFTTSWIKEWNNYQLKLNLSGTYKSDKFYLEEDTEKMHADPYSLWKFTTNHTIKRYTNFDIIISAGVDNIFNYVDDRPYGSHYGTLNPGRTLFASIKINYSKNQSK